MLPDTFSRVEEHTPPGINAEIRQRIHDRLRLYEDAPPEILDRRLAELDQEWDMERTLETNAAAVSLIGIALAVGKNRNWLILPAVVGGFLLQHALQGWCPPVSLFRRIGIRTASEIDYERYALKVMRGDFGNLETALKKGSPKTALAPGAS